MKKSTLKRLCLLAVLAMTTACIKMEDNTKIPGTNPETFSFATTKDYTLSVDYKLPADYDIVFEIYTEQPTDENGDRKQNISPIFKGMTDKGKLQDISLRLPTYVSKIYLLSGDIGAPEEVEILLNNTAISWTNAKMPAPKNAPASRAAFTIPEGMRTLGTWDAAGVPSYIARVEPLSAELAKDINYSLPASKSVPKYHPSYLEGDPTADIIINTPTGIELSMIYTGGTMQNVFGYFVYDKGKKPSTKEDIGDIFIAFPRVNRNSTLEIGTTIKLKYWTGTEFVDEFPAGKCIGWVFMANSFINGNIRPDERLTHYSAPEFNRESNPELRKHSILLYHKTEKLFIVAFEDQNREVAACDNDFHDIIFLATPTNPNLTVDINGVIDVTEWKDTDNDGVHDLDDEFPTDDKRAFSIHYPAKGEYGSIAFEDLWPHKGDYDMNDLVMHYNSIHYVNRYNNIHSIEDRFKLANTGSKYENGFGYQFALPDSRISKHEVASAVAREPMTPFSLNNKGLETGQNFSTVIVTPNANRDFKANGNQMLEYSVKTTFGSHALPKDVGIPPYNPFIIINTGAGNRDKEVHLPGQKPTGLASEKYFGTGNDVSNPKQGTYYVSTLQFPFAITIPSEFRFPAENTSINGMYPSFTKWVSSNGTTNQHWYK